MDILNTLTQTLRSMTKSLDVIYVVEGLKRVSRIIVNDSQIDVVVKLLWEFNLKIKISDFKIKKEIDVQRKYSDKGVKIDKNSIESGEFFLYIARNEIYAEKAKFYEENNDHINLGRILGYPECCINFFKENFPIESKRNNDYVLATLRNSTGFRFPFYNNTAIRHLDLTLLSYFPCNFNCSMSIVIGKRNLKQIRILSEGLHKTFVDMLKSAVIYSEYDGVFVLRDFTLKGNQLNYKGIIGTINNELSLLLKKEEKIKINNRNELVLGDRNLKGNDIGIIVFE